ncbi:MAG TPA: M14 family metallopeptidase [Oscillatoriaceae cyanobacterium]
MRPIKPLLTTLCVALALAGCGVSQNPTAMQALDRAVGMVAMGETGPAKLVRLHFRDRAQLNALAHAGVDLFENVDNRRNTVDASLTPKTEAIVRQMGVAFEPLPMRVGLTGTSFPHGYQSVAQVEQDMQAIASAHPTFVHFTTIGQSLKGQPIGALEICSHPGQNLPAVRLQAGQHARELPPVEIMSRLMHLLADGYGKDQQITSLVDTRDIWIVPIVNPDGRVKVQQGDAMWRKNVRAPYGVDVNRNADDHFSEGDHDQSEDDYGGKAPFSEPETQAIRDLCAQHHFALSLDMHNYAGMILWPPGYDDSTTKDEATFERIGDTIAKKIGYQAGTIARTIYNTYGDTSTWEYDAHGTLAFAAELNDSGFNPSFSEVDKDWSDWKDNLLYLIDQADQSKHVPLNLPNLSLR